MSALALILFVVLGAVTALHLYWAFGGLWPADNTAALARTVIGNNGEGGMPGRGLTLAVAGLIFAAGALPLLHLTGILPDWLSRAGLWALVLVFFARGAITYARPSMAAKMSQPFRRLNARYFSPLCLLLGAGFLVLALYS